MRISAPVVFPLYPITDDSKCGCGHAGCGRVGKHPAVKWADLKLGDPVPRPAPGAGYGLKTGAAPKGSGVFVVDLDGPDAMDAWIALGGSADTLTVETPRGAHLYFAHPGFPVATSAGVLAKGIDVRGEGGFVVGPGSPHRSGGAYELLNDVPPVAAPEWLLSWLRDRKPNAAEVQSYPGDETDPTELEYKRGLFEQACKTMPASVEGQNGDRALWRLVQYGAADLRLPVDVLLPLVREHFDPRCSPPWGRELDERVRHKARDAKTKSTRPLVEPPPAALAGLFNGTPRTNVNSELTSLRPAPSVQAGGGFVGVPASVLVEPLPPVKYLIQHFGIAQGRPTLLSGYGGLGKTIVAQALALHIASGLPTCWSLPIASGSVWHFDYEMTRAPLQRRYQRLAVGHEIPLQDCDLHLCSMPEIYLSDTAAQDALSRATEDVSLAIIDNLSAATATSSLKENEAGIRRYLDMLTRVTEKTGCAFLVLVHERKASKEDGADPLQMVRGNSSITAAANSVVRLVADKDTGTLALSQPKASSRRAGDEVKLKMVDVVGGGIAAKEDDDSPGLVVCRLDASEIERQKEQSLLEKRQERIKGIKEAMIKTLANRPQDGTGLGLAHLYSLVNGQTNEKIEAKAQLVGEDRMVIFHYPGQRGERVRLA